jgi:hypothetical protein
MIRCSASRHILLLAGTIGTLAVAVCPAAAQQTPAAPEAPPPWAQGRPEAAIGAKLAPIVPPPLPTAVDKLPTEKLKAPKGFKIEVYASGLARRTAGNSSPSVPTTSSISTSAHRAISACHRPPTRSSAVSISTAAARKSLREGFGKSSAWTGTRC